jgi:hypothetical protein
MAVWLTIALGVAAPFLANCNKSHSPESPLSHPPESALVSVLPIPKDGPTISLPGLDKLIHEDFLVVTDVRKLPESVKVSFCNIEKCNFVGVKFDMVNPGETMSTDYIIPDVPNKQLRFAALNGHSAIVFYELGGYADQLCVTAFDFREHTSWGASLKSFRVNTLDQLRTAISDRQFTRWSRRR